MAVEGLFLCRSNFHTSAIAPVCEYNDNVDLNFLTAWYRPREFVQCLPWNFASSRKLCSLVEASVRGDWREGGAVLTKRVTVKCCSVKLTEFMLVAAVLVVASTSYNILKYHGFSKMTRGCNKKRYPEFPYKFPIKDICICNSTENVIMFCPSILVIFNG